MFVNSNIKRDFGKIYHQQRVNLNDSGKDSQFIFVQNSYCYQKVSEVAYLQLELTHRKNGGHFDDDNTDMIGLLNYAVAQLFKEATIATSGGSEIEINKYGGPFSTGMTVLTIRDGDSSTNFDKIKEGNINERSLKHQLIDNHAIQANKGKVLGRPALDRRFGFCFFLKKVT